MFIKIYLYLFIHIKTVYSEGWEYIFAYNILYFSGFCLNLKILFEPTDIAVCYKPFQTQYWNFIKFITPNLSELKEIAKTLKIACNGNSQNPINEAAEVGIKLAKYIDNIIVTLGSDGIVIVRRGLANDNFPKSGVKNAEISARHYPAQEIKDFINVSGAGDCFASGFIAGMIAQEPEDICVSIGFASARTALYSSAAVPKEIFQKNHKAWKTHAFYKTL